MEEVCGGGLLRELGPARNLPESTSWEGPHIS